jgi:hypothetical protein
VKKAGGIIPPSAANKTAILPKSPFNNRQQAINVTVPFKARPLPALPLFATGLSLLSLLAGLAQEGRAALHP